MMQKLKKLSVRQVLFSISVVLILTGFIVVDFSKAKDENIVINIDEKNGYYFVTKDDVVRLIDEIKFEHPTASRLNRIELKSIEEKLKSIDFVLDAQVSRDLKGNLIINIEQDQPIARLIGNNGDGGYISRDRDLLNLSDGYAARVMLISGSGADSLLKSEFLHSEQGKELCEFVEYINSEPFWRAMVTQLDLDSDMDITIYPQIGKQRFEFGKSEGYLKKLKKMQTFYDEIVPKKGWGEYKVVKLQYEGQIVCK
ncbi:hypothetical protein R9C00_19115 [Flammeovirgaceae bacterium SG7u.111]|nr:hypothetical protein [Flammeovirgaceae bacterium SG7u.132]WPO33811.1 hypothetical protein R9C00_19115 [Flammeovirgaceae bacterium SG7u.111]